MGYKLILAWEDTDEDMELVQYPLPIRVGHHDLDHIRCGNRGRAYDVTVSIDVKLASRP